MIHAQPPHRPPVSRRVWAVAALFVLVVVVPGGRGVRAAPVGDCDGVALTIERSDIVVFRLPEQAGETFSVEPDDELVVWVWNIPSSGRVEGSLRMPFGTRITKTYEWAGETLGGSYEIEVHPADFARYVRGAYDAEVALFDKERLLCRIPLRVRLVGFGGAVPAAAAGAAAAAAAATAATAAWSASGASLKLKLSVAVRRRRRHGWRRWAPVPAWRRTAVSTVIGVLTGLLTTVALQQAGATTLTTGSVVSGSLLGGGVSFGAGLVWGSVLAFLRSPEEEEPATSDAGCSNPPSGRAS